jgi:plasmid stabilization system protein ParE
MSAPADRRECQPTTMAHTPGRDYEPHLATGDMATIWGELSNVCRRVYRHLYETRNKAAAKRYRRRLESITQQLPDNDLAILREEALALLHELEDDVSAAVQHREQEIGLIERLHASVRKSIESGRYDSKMASSIMADWDDRALKKRRAILKGLKSRATTAQKP